MKKKVLHVSAGGLNPGGVGTVIFSIVESLYREFDFSCVVFSRRSEAEKKFEKYGKLYRINCYPLKGKRDYFELITRPFKLYFGIRRICKQNHIDVIHCHNQRDEWICLLAAKHAHVPVRIAHSHVANASKKTMFIEKAYKNLSPAMLRRVATVKVGCSKVACEQLYLDNNYIVIPNSIDLNTYTVARKTIHTRTNFIHVGRFNYAKNQEFVVETFSEICKQISDVHLFLVGYGEKSETTRLRNLIEKFGVTDCVEMVPGDCVDVSEYYAKSDYMIFPSRFEGFGIALIEAQAMDIHCYVSEIIQPEVDLGLISYLCLSDGPKKWADYIVNDINNRKKNKCNLERLSKYSNESICACYAELYKGMSKK